ncbi:MAG: hypothetical protein JWO67_5919 [Streptosporangiaceae bacterium]|nr:hypothetical protein [Streptosporangiaceae bacterium]
MVFAIALAGVAVLAAVVVLATGRGGELAETHPDHPPLPLPGTHLLSGTDAALLRLPTGLWGYHVRITDEALEQLALALTQRDTRIAVLEQQLAQLRTTQRGADGRAAPEAERGRQQPWATPPGRLSGSAHELAPVFDPYEAGDPRGSESRRGPADGSAAWDPGAQERERYW